jgi:hypothetical protein
MADPAADLSSASIAAHVAKRKSTKCGHTFPDVRNVAGVDICRICPA